MDYLMTAVQDNDGGRLRQMIRNRKKARASQDPSKQRDPTDFLQNACEAAAGSNCIAALEVILDEGGRIESGERFEQMLHHLRAKLIVHRPKLEMISAASNSGSLEVFEFLIARGWDVNQELGLSGDALIMASTADNLELVKFLIAHGADPNANLRSGRHTPLECAVLSSTSTMKALVDAGAQILGHSALQMAACYGKTDNISYLLDCGAPIDEVPHGVYRSALSEAALNGNVTAVKLLLEKGADLDVKDRNGKSALDLAMKNNHAHCVDVLREASGLPPMNRLQIALRAH